MGGGVRRFLDFENFHKSLTFLGGKKLCFSSAHGGSFTFTILSSDILFIPLHSRLGLALGSGGGGTLALMSFSRSDGGHL